MKRFLLILLFTIPAQAIDKIPANAYRYRKILIAEERRVWGLKMTQEHITMGASTIHQESRWNPLAQSSHAKGLTQFTDDSFRWASEQEKTIGSLGNVWEPQAAIRAMVWYHRWLWDKVGTRKSEEDIWAGILSSYNGGLGWLQRDQKLAAQNKKDPAKWWSNVEHYSQRSPQAFAENRNYVTQIWLRWRVLYRSF